METYVGKLGSRTISSATPVIIEFVDNQILQFPDEKEARGFLAFYHASLSARENNAGKIYCFQSGVWREATG